MDEEPDQPVNLLMISGDTSLARGQHGAFEAMLRHFSTYWDRIDVLSPGAPDATPRTVHGNVHAHPSPYPKALQPYFLLRRGGALLAERPYALITSHDYGFFYNGPAAWQLSRRSGVPYVSELHHVEGYPLAVTRRERVYRWLAHRYIPWAATRAAAFRVVNHAEMPELLRTLGVPEDKILVLPSLYLDYEVFHPQPELPPALRPAVRRTAGSQQGTVHPAGGAGSGPADPAGGHAGYSRGGSAATGAGSTQRGAGPDRQRDLDSARRRVGGSGPDLRQRARAGLRVDGGGRAARHRRGHGLRYPGDLHPGGRDARAAARRRERPGRRIRRGQSGRRDHPSAGRSRPARPAGRGRARSPCKASTPQPRSGPTRKATTP